MSADRDRDRNESGQYVSRRDPADVAEAMNPGEPYTTTEIAELVEWPRRSAYAALDTLQERGEVNKKQANSRMVMWIRPSE
jgi:DNA-binding IclR family transcriptional regulator